MSGWISIGIGEGGVVSVLRILFVCRCVIGAFSEGSVGVRRMGGGVLGPR